MKKHLITFALCGVMILHLFQFSKSCPELARMFPNGMKYKIIAIQ